VFREFATPAETSGFFGEVRNLISQLAGLMSGNPKYTDNASVSLAAVDAAAARSGSSGSSSGGKLLLAMSETPAANYLVNPDDLSTVEQVGQAAGYWAGATITAMVVSVTWPACSATLLSALRGPLASLECCLAAGSSVQLPQTICCQPGLC
jgi:hypothetical protein